MLGKIFSSLREKNKNKSSLRSINRNLSQFLESQDIKFEAISYFHSNFETETYCDFSKNIDTDNFKCQIKINFLTYKSFMGLYFVIIIIIYHFELNIVESYIA